MVLAHAVILVDADPVELTARANAFEAALGTGRHSSAHALTSVADDGELTITHEPNMLVINGAKPETEDVQYLHRALALGPFVRRFELADHVNVNGAKLENGLLTIDLTKEIPEEMKPRRIAIDAAPTAEPSKQIEGNVAA